MGKTVRKSISDELYHIGENECWFEDMAKEGLHLKKIGVLFYRFEKGEPRDTRYRIDVLKNKPSEEQLAVYKECGWELAASNGTFYVYSAPAESGAGELHTDAMEQAHSLEWLGRRIKLGAVIGIIGILFWFVMMAFVLVSPRGIFYTLVAGQGIQQLTMCVLYTYMVWYTFRSYRGFRALYRRLADGIPVNHRADWKKRRRSNGGRLILLSLLLLVMSVANTVGLVAGLSGSELPLGPVSGLPALRLEEIEESGGLIREPAVFSPDGIDWGNKIEKTWSLLAPVRYETRETMVNPEQLWPDGKGNYNPRVTTTYYKLVFSGMAEGLLRDMIKWEDRFAFGHVKTTELTGEGYDLLILSEDTRSLGKTVYAARGNQAVIVDYYGKAGPDRLLELLPGVFS